MPPGAACAKVADEALRLYRLLVASTGDMISCQDAGGRYLRVSPASRRLLGYEPEELVGRPVSAFVHWEDVARVSEAMLAALAPEGRDYAEYRHVTKSGAYVWVEAKGHLFRDAATGEVTGAVRVVSDISERKHAETRLMEDNERLRLALDAAKCGTFEYNPQTGQVVWDDQMKAIWGFSRQEVPSYDAILARVHPEDRERVVTSFEEALELVRGGDYESQYRVIWPDGSVHWLEPRGRVYTGDAAGSGRPYRVIGIEQDISERKRTQEALRESEEYLRSLLSAVQAGVILQGRDGRIVHANEAATRIPGMGTTASDGGASQGLRWWMVDEAGARVPDDQHPSMATLRTGQPIRNAIRGLCDGSRPAVRWLMISTEPLRATEGGEVTEVLTTFLDITDLKHAQEELRAQRDLAKNLVDTAQAIVLVLDPEGRIISLNPYLEEISGYRLEEVQGQDWFDTFLPDRIRPQIRGLFRQAVADLQTQGNVDPIVKKNGEECLIEWYDKTLKDVNGTVMGLLCIGQDVTERERTGKALTAYQEQLRALRRRRVQSDEHERRRIATQLHDQAGQLLVAIRIRFAAWRKLESETERDLLSSEIGGMIDEVIREIRALTFELSPPILYELGLGPALEKLGESLCKKEDVAFDFHDDGRSLGICREQANELYRAARELILNVLKHAQTRSMSVTLSAEGDRLRLVVTDDGVGMEPLTGERAMKGLGGTFGLFSIREGLRDFDGRFDIDSSPGEGTRATITVPIGRAEELEGE